MTLAEIISAALRQLGYTTDAQTQKNWHDNFMQLANEGLVDLGEGINQRRTDSLTVADGEIDISALPRECTKVIGVEQDGASLTFGQGSASNKLTVSGSGSVAVHYRYLPKEMTNDTDRPEIPPHMHNLLVTYVCACHHMTQNVDSQGRYSAIYNKYLAGKARARKHYGEPENYKITNKGW